MSVGAESDDQPGGASSDLLPSYWRPRLTLGRGRPEHWWGQLGAGLLAAGAIYPTVLVLMVVLLQAVVRLVSSPLTAIAEAPGSIIPVALVVGVVGLVGGLVSFAVTGLVCLVVLPACAATLRMLDRSGDAYQSALMAGSLVPLVATLPLSLLLGSRLANRASLASGTALVCGLAVLLAIAMGQTTALLATPRETRRRHRPLRRHAGRQRGFSVATMLVVTTLVSIVLAMLKTLGLLTTPMAIASGVGLVLSWGLHRPVCWLVNKRFDRHRTRRWRERIRASQ